MATFAVSTPSPPARVHTPGTPKHGYGDSWEPFSPRKSARISSQRSDARTPSPRTSQHQHNRVPKKQSSSTFSTPATSPQKKRMPAMDSVRRASGALTSEGAAHAADSLGIGAKPRQQKSHASAATASHGTTSAMLPTPAKTPRKQPNAKTEAASRAVARSLFSSETDAIPTPKKKKAKKYTGLTLESFTAEEIDDPINIFTDTRDRLPELDSSAENPFYGNDPAPVEEPSKRRSKRKQVTIPGEGKQAIEDAIRRDDGIVYVFRGKKFFRKFSDLHEGSSEPLDDDEAETTSHRPVTRSSVKPRLLFPRAAKSNAVETTTTTTIEDEEADTDIEDHVFNTTHDDHLEAPETPVKAAPEKVDTPEAPRFGPTSPPSTVRATRSTTKLLAEESPMKKMGKPRSPFDGWRRSKSRAEPHGQKREGELLGTTQASKRQRS
ncbi:hypothetical protein F5X96DRAFT_422301 [Biscogniauxia mediterranea]|nr:hypothetical protein F5X96DRAFT_422301 [Biscogniauxia mediterranea]